jgi:quinol monooxygenase YgiN
MAEIVVVAKAKALAGKEAELENALRACVKPTHGEAGCARYALHRASSEPGVLVMIEKWGSKADLDRHLASAHVQALFKQIPNLVQTPPELLVLDPLQEGDAAKGKL